MPTTPSLRTAREFESVYRGARKVRRGPLTVYVVRAHGSASRLGLAVGARVGGAVVRNRIRRRLRAAMGRCRPSAPVDVVVRAQASVAGMDFQELVEHLCEGIEEGLAR